MSFAAAPLGEDGRDLTIHETREQRNAGLGTASRRLCCAGCIHEIKRGEQASTCAPLCHCEQWQYSDWVLRQTAFNRPNCRNTH